MSTVTVSTAAQFQAAVTAAAKAGATGETILLEPGTYQNLSVNNYAGTGPLTIESASTSNEAVVEGLSVNSSSNLTVENLSFSNANVTSNQNNNLELNVYDSSNVKITGDTFSGSSSDTLAAKAGRGVLFRDDTGVTLSNSSFKYLLDGIDNTGDNTVTESNNSFSNIFDDGIDTSATSNISISGNNFTTFHTDSTDSDHPDAIQFWTTDVTSNSTNISVTNNTITRGAGTAIQGIFITSQNTYGYSNVTVSGNTVTGEQPNGIWVDSSSNINVQNNTITPFTDQVSRLLLTDDTGGTASNNKVGTLLYTSGNSGVTTSNDTTVAAVAAFVSSVASLAPTTSVTTTTTLTTSTAGPHSTLAPPHTA